jgi:alpha-L-fucosidase 2
MLLQSYAGFIEIMPAVPGDWKDISFDKLRAEGAFLISAKKTGGQLREIKIIAEQGGKTKLRLPDTSWYVVKKKGARAKNLPEGFLELSFRKGGEIVMKNRYE